MREDEQEELDEYKKDKSGGKVLSTLATSFAVAKGAIDTAEFGKKGMLAGGAIGLGADLIGKGIASAFNDDESSVTHNAIKGFVAGATLSAFSSGQELYTFFNPNEIQGLSSMNATTSISSEIDTAKLMLTKEGRTQISGMADKINQASKNPLPKPSIKHKANAMAIASALTGLRPESVMTDLARVGMINNEAPGKSFNKVIAPIKRQAMDMINGVEGDGIVKSGAVALKNKVVEGFGNLRETINIADSVGDENPWLTYDTQKSYKAETVTDTINNTDMESLVTDRNYKKNVKASVVKGSDEYADLLNQISGAKAEVDIRSSMANDILTDPLYEGTDIRRDAKAGIDSGNAKIAELESMASAMIDTGDSFEYDNGVYKVNGDDVDRNTYYEKAFNDKTMGFEDDRYHFNKGDDGDASYTRDYNLNAVELEKGDDLKTRTSKYLTRYADYTQESLDQITGLSDTINAHYGTDFDMGDIKTSDDITKYIDNIEPGAYGTYKELDRVKGKNNAMTKLVSLSEENKTGSPLWARALDRDIRAGDTQIESYTDTNKKGKKVKRNRIKGGNKTLRGLALLGDIAVGGLTMAATYAVPAMLSGGANGNNNKEKDLANASGILNGGM